MIGEAFFMICQEKKIPSGRTDRRQYLQLSFVIASVAPILASFSSSPVCKQILYHPFSFSDVGTVSFTSNFPISVASSVSVRLCERKWCPNIECVNSGFHKYGNAHLFSFAEPFTLPSAIHTLPLNFESWKEKLWKTGELGKYSPQFKQL